MLWGSIPAKGLKIVFSSFILNETPEYANLCSLYKIHTGNYLVKISHVISISVSVDIFTAIMIFCSDMVFDAWLENDQVFNKFKLLNM